MILRTDHVDAYLSAVSAILDEPGRAGAGVPVLCRPGSPLDVLVTRWSALLGHAGPRARSDRPGRAVVAVGDDPVVSAAARLLAVLTGRTALAVADVKELPALWERHDLVSTALVGIGTGFDVPGVEPSAFWRLDATDATLGILTGRDRESLTWFVAKSLLTSTVPGDAQTLLLPDRKPREDTASAGVGAGGVEVLYGAAAEEALPALAEDERVRALIAVEAHGRADHLGVRDGIICGDRLAHLGRSSEPEGIGRVPQCAFGHGCFKPGARVAISRMPAQSLFLHSCTSSHTEADMYEKSFLLGLAALEGPARHVLGTVRPMHDGGHEVGLVSALTAAGASAGEVTRLLNASYHQHRGEPAPYLLLGDPELPFADGPVGGPDAGPAVELDASAGALPLGGRRTAVLGSGPGVLVVGDATGDEDGDGPGLPAGVGALTVRRGDRTDVVAWSTEGPLPEGALPLVRREGGAVAADGGAEELHARWDHVDHGIASGGALGLLPKDLTGRLQELRDLAAAVGTADRDARFFPGRLGAVRRAAARLDQRIRDADRALMHALLGRNGKPFDADDRLESAFVPLESQYGRQVCWCGRDAVVSRLRPRLGAREVRRKYNCMQCGDYAQVAVDGVDVRWEAPEFVASGGELEHSFRIANPLPHPVTGVLALSVSPWYGGDVSFRPGIATFSVAPGGTCRVGVTMRAAGLKPHRYTVDATVVSHLRINAYRKFVQVRPAGPVGPSDEDGAL
uniref:MilH n=1 Tax=Streptomyces rimofaciens TaxID=504097 RepID=H9BDW7_9ACTN|nr:MilH [Streptomyces rimofaciens]